MNIFNMENKQLHHFSHIICFLHVGSIFNLSYFPCTDSIDRPFFLWSFQAIEEATEAVDSTLHHCFIVFCCRNNEIKFLISYFRITCATTVNHNLHLPGHGIEINRSCHYNYIGSNHLLHDFRCIILLWTGFTVHTANTTSRTRMNRFVFQKNLLYFIARLDSTFHKFITKQIRITTFTWTGRNYQNFFSHNFLLLLFIFRILFINDSCCKNRQIKVSCM